jgi:hypothetical protein
MDYIDFGKRYDDLQTSLRMVFLSAGSAFGYILN